MAVIDLVLPRRGLIEKGLSLGLFGRFVVKVVSQNIHFDSPVKREDTIDGYAFIVCCFVRQNAVRCQACKEYVPLWDAYLTSNKRYYKCRSCSKAQGLQNYYAHREECNKRARRWQMANSQKVKEYHRQYYQMQKKRALQRQGGE